MASFWRFIGRRQRGRGCWFTPMRQDDGASGELDVELPTPYGGRRFVRLLGFQVKEWNRQDGVLPVRLKMCVGFDEEGEPVYREVEHRLVVKAPRHVFDIIDRALAQPAPLPFTDTTDLERELQGDDAL